jgi:hypothetical protein
MHDTRLVLVKGRAGLGNRILSALTGIAYARLTGRGLFIHWNDGRYSDDRSNVFHRFFQSPHCNPTDEIPLTDSVRPSIWRGQLHEPAYKLQRRLGISTIEEALRQTSVDITRGDYPEDLLVMWTHTEGISALKQRFPAAFEAFGPATADDILRGLLRRDLVLHPEVRKRVDDFRRASFDGPTVGVHVRYTDHRVRLEAILEQLDRRLWSRPELRVFLSTDSLPIKTMFERRYRSTITTPHWYSAEGRAIHRDSGRPDRAETGIEALIDLYLLAECDSLIVDSKSSFAYLARLLTRAPAEQVVDIAWMPGAAGVDPDRGRDAGRREPARPVGGRRGIWRGLVRSGPSSWGLRFPRRWESA